MQVLERNSTTPDWGATEGRRWSEEPGSYLPDQVTARERTLTALADEEIDGLDLLEHGDERAALARLLRTMARAALSGRRDSHLVTSIASEAHRMLDAILDERGPAWWEDCDEQSRRERMARAVGVATC